MTRATALTISRTSPPPTDARVRSRHFMRTGHVHISLESPGGVWLWKVESVTTGPGPAEQPECADTYKRVVITVTERKRLKKKKIINKKSLTDLTGFRTFFL